MRLSTVVCLGLAAIVQAQDQTVQVQVGGTATDDGGPLQFKPSNFTATKGSVVSFVFSGNPGNHSITQSTFSSPCAPMSGGFDSGWVAIPQGGVSPSPVWNLTITDDQTPIWFFCKALLPTPHCTSGMVGAINPPSSGSNTFSDYVNNAKSFQGQPGQDIGALVGNGASASAIPGPIPSGAAYFGTPAASATAPNSASTGASNTASGSNPSSTNSNSAGSMVKYDSLLALFAGVLGIALA